MKLNINLLTLKTYKNNDSKLKNSLLDKNEWFEVSSLKSKIFIKHEIFIINDDFAQK
jgi:hypothetical protein